MFYHTLSKWNFAEIFGSSGEGLIPWSLQYLRQISCLEWSLLLIKCIGENLKCLLCICVTDYCNYLAWWYGSLVEHSMYWTIVPTELSQYEKYECLFWKSANNNYVILTISVTCNNLFLFYRNNKWYMHCLLYTSRCV